MPKLELLVKGSESQTILRQRRKRDAELVARPVAIDITGRNPLVLVLPSNLNSVRQLLEKIS